jgi:hypothetical protein
LNLAGQRRQALNFIGVGFQLTAEDLVLYAAFHNGKTSKWPAKARKIEVLMIQATFYGFFVWV